MQLLFSDVYYRIGKLFADINIHVGQKEKPRFMRGIDPLTRMKAGEG